MIWPESPVERDRFVLSRRPSRVSLDPWRLQGVRVDDEPDATGRLSTAATFFLTGRECPWRCAMCDLWQYTLPDDTPRGSIPRQISDGCRQLEDLGVSATHVKLYNAGSFFDVRAVPEEDYADIARALERFEHVVVESHPSLVGTRTVRFRDLLRPSLEVAMGLETAHPEALARLHKRMDVPLFMAAARALDVERIALRVFLLVAPPFIPSEEQDEWLLRSLDVAIEAGAAVISLIPTRSGNGTLEALAQEGLFTAPTLASVQRSFERARAHVGTATRLLLDPWDGTGVERLES